MKKIVSLILIAMLALSLTACGGKNSNSQSSISDKSSFSSSEASKEAESGSNSTVSEESSEIDESRSNESSSNSIVSEESSKETKSESSADNATSKDLSKEFKESVKKDIKDTIESLEKDYKQLKADIDTYDKYSKNADKIKAFYDNINETHKSLCIRMREYALDYADKIISSNTSNDEKYEELDKLYKIIYDGGESIYDGILADAYDSVPYAELSKLRTQEYKWWSNTRSNVYKQWSNFRSDVYKFWSSLRSKVWNDEIDETKEIMSDFKADINELKEKN
jgi:hypothetical protein